MAPHMSGDMSTGGAGTLNWTDVHKEQYVFDFADANATASTSPNAFTKSIDIGLNAPDGGLEHDELARIEAYRLTLSAQSENPDSGVEKFPTRPVSYQIRGGWGFNVDDEELPDGTLDNTSEKTTGENETVYVQDTAGLIQQFVIQYEAPYFNQDPDDTGKGPYAAGASGLHVSGDGLTSFSQDMGIEGPYVDTDDDIGFVAVIVEETNKGQSLATGDARLQEGFVGIDLFYSVHELDGVRSNFSPPGER